MSIFDFITDERFRTSLESDYREMKACLETNSWKAVHVLAGSIVEAVLIDYLASQGIVNKKEALSLDLGKAIVLSNENKIISRKSVDLSSAVKEYRNLIHPGRIIRLNETVTKDGASVAQSVVGIIIDEVSKKMKENYGYTAEQIMSKLERDSSAKAILVHLLNETKGPEIERLMTKVLPPRYLEILQDEYSQGEALISFDICFRKSFEHIDKNAKRRIMKWLVTVLKEGDEKEILSFATSFLRAFDLKYLNKADQALIKEHLLSRLSGEANSGLIQALEGLGGFLLREDVDRFVDPLIKMILGKTPLGLQAKKALEREHQYTSQELDVHISKRIKAWEDMFVTREEPEKAAAMEKLKSIYEVLPPF